MTDSEDILRSSPVGFETAVAYALHREMRRLVILAVVGTLLVPSGLGVLSDLSTLTGPFTAVLVLIEVTIGLVLTVGGAALLFGGLIGTVFKLVTDAVILAGGQQSG